VKGPSISGRSEGGVVVAWLDRADEGWTVRALAADLVDDEVLTGPSVLVHPAGKAQQQFEFLMVTHNDAGQALIAYVMDDGDCDPAPNPVESRGSQCMYVTRQAIGEVGSYEAVEETISGGVARLWDAVTGGTVGGILDRSK
jgi:hypothetical protein